MRFLLAFLAVFAISLPTVSTAATTMSMVEAMTSTVFQENQTSFSGLGLRVAFDSDVLIPGLTFVPGIEYWRNHTHVSAYEIDANRRDATLNLDARHKFQFKNVEPYLGAGFGLHFLTTEVEAPSFGIQRAETSLIKGGVSLLGGVMFPVGGKFQNLLELKYHHVTDYTQTKLNFGIAFRF